MTKFNPYVATPDLTGLLIDFATTVTAAGLEPSLLELVKIRASQINGCALCLEMHATEARRKGETEQRIYLLDAWRDVPVYSARERAAIAWTEALTRLPEGGVPEAIDTAVAAEFTDRERVALALMIVTINSFNRLNVGFRLPPLSAQRKAA